MTNLSELIKLLTNEEELINHSSTEKENFNIKTILSFIENESLYNPDFFLSQLEANIVDFFKIIKYNTEYSYYTNLIEKWLSKEIVPDDIIEIINILKEMQKTYFTSTQIEDITVKKLS